MAALKALRNASISLAAFGLAASPAVADDAAPYSQSRAANVLPVAVQDIRIPVKPSKGIGARAIQMSAAMVSANTQVLVFYGDSQEAFDRMYEGAQRAKAAGVPIAGIIDASPLKPEVVQGVQIAGSNQIEFYADGQVTATIDNADKETASLARDVTDELLRGYNQIIRPRQKAAMADEAAPYAQSHPANVQPVAAQSIRIPVKDMQGLQPRGVQMSAAMVSANTQVLVFYGDSQEAFDRMYEGAQQAKAAGVPIAGIIAASPLTPEVVHGVQIAGRNQIEFYADGQVTATIDSPEREPQKVTNLVRANLVRGQDIMREQRRQVAMITPQARQ